MISQADHKPIVKLPIDDVLPQITTALKTRRAVVVQAPPGAGKTTKVPIALLEAGLIPTGTQLVMLEPRRIAARAAARSLARNLGEEVGKTVGYKVRFEEVASRETKIMVVTEGILGRRFLSDPTLDGISVVILDEVHERSIHTDLALAFTRELLDVRDDLKLVVMSATLDAEGIANYVDGAVVTSEGRPFPVDVRYLDRRDDRRLEDRMAGAIKNLIAEPNDDGGDVLCFLPGAPEIRRTQDALMKRDLPRDVEVVPLYGALSPQEQDRAIRRGDRRRVVLATNVAETSLTLEGVSAVVDSGLMKAARHDPATDREHLDTVRISLASAEQRAGRAGRLRPGRCVRLWTTTEHATLEASFAPEIQRADLSRVILDVLAFHPGDPASFPFFEAPAASAIDRALSLLKMLGAVDDSARLTPLGRKLAQLPTHPRIGAMLLAAADRGVLEDAALYAAILEDDRSWPRDTARETTDSDLATIAPRASHEVKQVARSLLRSVKGEHGSPSDVEIKRALLAGFPDRIARRRKPGAPEALMIGGRGVKLAQESGVRDAPLFLALALDAGDRASALVRVAEAVTLDDVKAVMPQLVQTKDEARFDPDRGALLGVRRTRVADLVVEERDGIAVTPEASARALADAFAADFERLFKPEGGTLERLRFAAKALPEEEWPAVDNDAIKALLPDVCAGKRTIADVQAVNWGAILLERLPWALRKVLDLEIPPRIEVPTGNMITVDYGGDAPVLAVRLQELFGMTETPRVARGRVPVVLHLLSPGYKPVQVTTDLASFWANTYAQVKKELRARYPKHSWPDDPLTATPTARAKRRGT